MDVELVELLHLVQKVKIKLLHYVIQSARKDIQEWDLFATKTVQRDIQISLHSVTSLRDMEEELDHLLNARIVRSGDSCGILNVSKASMLSVAACAMPRVRTTCGI